MPKPIHQIPGAANRRGRPPGSRWCDSAAQGGRHGAFVRRYIHENLCYRFVIMSDGAAAYAVEAASGWEDIAAFRNHAGFVKNHQQKADRIAVIVAHNWQHWLIGAVRVFLYPEVRAYDKGHESEALQWVLEK